MSHENEKAEIKEGVSLAKKKGRNGDTTLGHLSRGDLVIPRGQVTARMREVMNEFFDVDRYTVGHEANSKNPNTGLPEFFDDTGPTDDGDGDTGPGQEGTAGWGLNGYDAVGAGAFGDPSANDATQGWSLGAFFDRIGQALGPASMAPTSDGVAGGNGQGSMNSAGGELLSSNPPTGSLAPPQAPYINPMASPVVPTLPAPVAPDIPDSYANIGRYYTEQSLGNTDFARNLLAPYLQGDKNVYGR